MGKRLLSFVLIIALCLSGCAQNQKFTDASSDSFSANERQLGDTIHAQIIERMPLYDNLEVTSYVDRVGQYIAQFSGRKEIQYRFTILNDPRVYATHAPGGYVYVTTGLLNFLRTEAELAAVLAYEVAALQYKDPRLSNWKKAMDYLVQAGSVAAPIFGAIGGLSLLGLFAIQGLAGREKSLEAQVLAADRHALDYLAKAGYHPEGFVYVLVRAGDPQSAYRAYLYDYLESHPISVERLGVLNQILLTFPVQGQYQDSVIGSYFDILQSLQSRP